MYVLCNALSIYIQLLYNVWSTAVLMSNSLMKEVEYSVELHSIISALMKFCTFIQLYLIRCKQPIDQCEPIIPQLSIHLLICHYV